MYLNPFAGLQNGSDNWRPILKEAFFLSAYTLLCLFIFQPFGTYEYSHPHKIMQLGGYGLMILVLHPIFRKLSLQAGKNASSFLWEFVRFLATLLCLALVGFFYHGLVINGELEWTHLPVFLWLSGLFWLLPILAFLFSGLQRSRQPIPVETDQTLEHTGNKKLQLKGSSPYENFYFNPTDIFYLQSNGNYVMVYFRKEGELKSAIIRNTLNQIAGQLPGSDFTTIHRSFIVNLKQFDRLIREEGKPLLINQAFNVRIPVARNKISLIEEKLSDHC
jgi:hypothetical protein